jgi:hypothetical protein
VAEQYIPEFGKLAKTNNTLILPLNISDVGSMVAAMTNVVRKMSPSSSNGSGSGTTAVPGASTHGGQ